MARLRIKRKSYARKAHPRKSHIKKGKRISQSYVDRTRVPSSTFYIKDRGRKGRGPKVLPKLKRKGVLGKGFFSKSMDKQKKILGNVADKHGEKVAQGQMQWIATMQKRTNPKIALRAAKLRQWVANQY